MKKKRFIICLASFLFLFPAAPAQAVKPRFLSMSAAAGVATLAYYYRDLIQQYCLELMSAAIAGSTAFVFTYNTPPQKTLKELLEEESPKAPQNTPTAAPQPSDAPQFPSAPSRPITPLLGNPKESSLTSISPTPTMERQHASSNWFDNDSDTDLNPLKT